MSVFSDFQRLWMQRFPQSSLSDAWEQDVRASLERHKQKILEISKELEQETLYVEYLERLLSDVEKYKETGGDPTTLFEAATTTTSSTTTSSQQQTAAALTTAATTSSIEDSSSSSVMDMPPMTTIGLRESLNGSSSHHMNDNKQVEESVDIRKDRDIHKNSANRESSKRGSYKEQTNNGSTTALDNRTNSKQLLDTTTEVDDKDSRTEKDIKNMQIQKHGALNQCITELASGFKAAEMNAEQQQQQQQQSQKQKHQQTVVGGKLSADSKNGIEIATASGSPSSDCKHSTNSNRSSDKPSHFVTVIEVNEPIIVEPSNMSSSSSSLISAEQQQAAAQSVAAVAAEVVPVSCASSTAGGPETIVASSEHANENELTFSSFDRKSTKIEPSAPPMSPAMTSSTSVAAMSSASTSPSSTLMTSSSSLFISNIDAKKKVPPRPPPKYIRRVEPPTVPGANIQLSSSPKRDLSTSSTGNNILYERGNSHIGLTSSSSGVSSCGGSLSNNNSPSSSLERNIKPSDILRQKSSDSLEAKSLASNRKTTPEMGKLGANLKATDLAEEFGRKIAKTESLEKTKRSGDGISKLNHSPTGSLGKTTISSSGSGNNGGGAGGVGASPTGSLSKFSSARYGNGAIAGDNASPNNTGSLEKMKLNDGSNGRNGGGGNYLETSLHSVGSKESLASQGNISEIIKSYESISSLSSDSTKAQNLDNEPYYDTVPLDNGDGEYVSLVPGGSVSTSSRDDLSTAGSTLPIGSNSGPYHHNQHLQQHHHSSSSRSHMSSQSSVIEPESPGRTSNYVNIDYFLHQRTETRSSSLDSDGEGDAPPQMRTPSHDEQTSQTPSA